MVFPCRPGIRLLLALCLLQGCAAMLENVQAIVARRAFAYAMAGAMSQGGMMSYNLGKGRVGSGSPTATRGGAQHVLQASSAPEDPCGYSDRSPAGRAGAAPGGAGRVGGPAGALKRSAALVRMASVGVIERVKNPLRRERGRGGGERLRPAIEGKVGDLGISVGQMQVIEGLVSASVATRATVEQVAKDLVSTALTKSVVLGSYDAMWLGMGRMSAAFGGFPAVVAASVATGAVNGIIQYSAPSNRRVKVPGRAYISPHKRQLSQALTEDITGYMTFFTIFHSVFCLMPALRASMGGQAVAASASVIMASYIPTDPKRWRLPDQKAMATYKQDLAFVPKDLITVKIAMEKAESLLRTCIFCCVNYAVGTRVGAF